MRALYEPARAHGLGGLSAASLRLSAPRQRPSRASGQSRARLDPPRPPAPGLTGSQRMAKAANGFAKPDRERSRRLALDRQAKAASRFAERRAHALADAPCGLRRRRRSYWSKI
jgi:hypothetical protein